MAASVQLRDALHLFAASVPNGKFRERGGVVLSCGGAIEFVELPNRAVRGNRYVTMVPAIARLSGDLTGFWHTHPGASLPSPKDLFELRRLNHRFGRSFTLFIAGTSAYTITWFTRFGIPRVRYFSEKIGSQTTARGT